jgi:nucleoid DNA-binding protein
MDDTIEEIIRELAIKNGYSINKARRLTKSIFKAIKDELESGNLNVVNVMNMGKFKLTRSSQKYKQRKYEKLSQTTKTDS